MLGKSIPEKVKTVQLLSKVWLWDFMNCSMPGFPVHHQLLELAQTHVPSSQWCRPTISSSVITFSCRQSFPASGSFPVSQLFASIGQNTGVSASTSVLPMNIQDWFPLGWTGLISLQSKGLSRVFSNTTVQKHIFFGTQLSFFFSAFFIVQLSHPWMTTGKTRALTRWTFVSNVLSLVVNMLSRLVIAFLPGCLSFNFMAAVTICSDFGTQKYSLFPLFRHLFALKWRDWMPWC